MKASIDWLNVTACVVDGCHVDLLMRTCSCRDYAFRNSKKKLAAGKKHLCRHIVAAMVAWREKYNM